MLTLRDSRSTSLTVHRNPWLLWVLLIAQLPKPEWKVILWISSWTVSLNTSLTRDSALANCGHPVIGFPIHTFGYSRSGVWYSSGCHDNWWQNAAHTLLFDYDISQWDSEYWQYLMVDYTCHATMSSLGYFIGKCSFTAPFSSCIIQLYFHRGRDGHQIISYSSVSIRWSRSSSI